MDTRALTKKLRVRGALNGFISTTDISAQEAVARARNWPGLAGVDYVQSVTHAKPFLWDDTQSKSFSLARGSANAPVDVDLPPADVPIVAFDYGMKYNILRRLRQHGFKVQV
ncbi:MAG: carbamoyl phosphate synthase small subunit, partial [Acidimicrobiales bacterium]